MARVIRSDTLFNVVRQVRTDGDDGIRGVDGAVFESCEDVLDEFGISELEVIQLLRQAGVHVVDQLETEQGFQ